MKYCQNCRAGNPRHRSACYRCNAALTRDERERRRQLRIENELREANGKPPLDVPEVDESVGPAEVEVEDTVPTFLLVLALLVVAGLLAYGLEVLVL